MSGLTCNFNQQYVSLSLGVSISLSLHRSLFSSLFITLFLSFHSLPPPPFLPLFPHLSWLQHLCVVYFINKQYYKDSTAHTHIACIHLPSCTHPHTLVIMYTPSSKTLQTSNQTRVCSFIDQKSMDEDSFSFAQLLNNMHTY